MMNCYVVAPSSVGILDAEVTLLQTVLDLLKHYIVCGSTRAIAARESGMCILTTTVADASSIVDGATSN
jgi:hypothetical protein